MSLCHGMCSCLASGSRWPHTTMPQVRHGMLDYLNVMAFAKMATLGCHCYPRFSLLALSLACCHASFSRRLAVVSHKQVLTTQTATGNSGTYHSCWLGLPTHLLTRVLQEPLLACRLPKLPSRFSRLMR